jgi:two-component system, LytTR family, sensor kinase
MGWIAYVGAWMAAALFWSLASASSAALSPLETLPWGLLTMSSAGVMGVAIWHLTRHIAWDWRAPRFYGVHVLALVVFAVVYSMSWAFPDLLAGRFGAIADGVRSSPVLIWSLLMGSWLYMLIAGLSYAIRAHRHSRAQEAAAAEARLLAQQAQLAALRARVNPHFLFNALHSVGALVTTDPESADRALESLGGLLRYTLGTEEEVLLAQEWRFTEDYLAFERLRLGERLDVEARIDPEALAVMVPPLILQPLVENAVRHGIADRPAGGRVSLSATLEGDRLMLCVADDGPGDAAGLREGLGLSSIRQRLAVLYDSRTSIDITQGVHGFSVTIGLPCGGARKIDSAA